jgi:predicted DNA-binding transcriptional regulator AlpA
MTRPASDPALEAPRPEPATLTAGLSPTDRPVDALAGRLALRLDEVAATLGVSRSAVERERRAGRFPKPDLTIGRMPLWQVESLRRWIEGGSRR